MTCSDVQRVLPEVLDGGPTGTLPAEFETHLKSCPDCSDLVSDLKLITSEAHKLEAIEEPSPQVWLRIAAQLRAEGLISEPATREPESVPEFARKPAAPRPILVPTSPRRRWSAWWLVPVAAGLVAAGSYVITHKPAPQVAQQQAPAIPVKTPAPVATPATETSTATNPAPVTAPAPQQTARKSVPSSRSKDLLASAAEPEPGNEEDQQFLSAVSTRAPSMRATYENQLNAVNANIRETQAYVNRNPGDADARQHLMDDYQQKALLYQIALDRIQ